MPFAERSVWFLGSVLAFAVLVAARVLGQASIPVVPGAFGFGMQTRAAYGGSVAPTVYRVTNLNDTGSGSLRAALEASGPRVVIFQISGTINLNADIYIRSPYVTVAGQTAPSPGITVRNYTLIIDTNDVLLQHFRVRPGGDTCNNGIQAWGTLPYNIVLDHMSVSWGQDENIVLYNSARPINATVWRSITAEGLRNTPGTEECSGGGLSPSHGLLIYAGTHNVFIGQTLFASNAQRNPYMVNNTRTVLMNNLVYHWLGPWGFFFGNHSNLTAGPWYASAVGNRFVGGPKTTNSTTDTTAYTFFYFTDISTPGNRIYRSDNTVAANGARQAGTIAAEYNQLAYNPNVGSPPAQAPLPTGFTPLASTAVEAFVLANAGARPADRDAVDLRIVQEVKNRTGNFISSPNQVGGYPTLAVNTRSLTLPSSGHSIRPSGYTALEEWLHSYSAAVGGGTRQTTLRPSTPTAVHVKR